MALRRKKKEPTGFQGTASLRMNALTGPLPPLPADALGKASVVLLDMGVQGGMASVTSYADGATSLYLSTGGGVIGVGTHPQARNESRAFLALAESSLGVLRPTNDIGDLAPGDIRILVRIGDQVFGASAPNDLVQRTEHPLHALWVQGQRVLTLIRLISEERQRQNPGT
jgi:hypothetical protein